MCEAQKAAELFIPIGRSPGLSAEGKTFSGAVTQVNDDGFVVAGRNTVIVTGATRIFLDRSAIKKSNGPGTLSDIAVGLFVEVYSPEAIAAWVKVRSK